MKLSLEIKNPCKKMPWPEMHKEERSRHCSMCKKSVFDFASWTDDQIIHFLNESDKEICARLSQTQVNRILAINSKSKINNWATISASILLIGASAVPVNAVEQHSIYWEQNEHREQNLRFITGKVNESKIDSLKRTISGRLIEEDTRQPLANNTIRVRETELSTITDSLGYFEIDIPDSYNKKEVVLYVDEGYGFEGPTERTLLVRDLPISDFIIEKPGVLVGEVTIRREKRWWQFWRKR